MKNKLVTITGIGGHNHRNTQLATKTREEVRAELAEAAATGRLYRVIGA